MDVTITRPLLGTLNDWPANIQDTIFAAMERLSQREQIPLAVIMSRCDVDESYAEGVPGRYFLHVILSEVVVADERSFNTKRIMSELPDDIKRLLN